MVFIWTLLLKEKGLGFFYEVKKSEVALAVPGDARGVMSELGYFRGHILME